MKYLMSLNGRRIICLGDLDFAQDGDGRWDIEMMAVQCPVEQTNITYTFQGSHQYYIKLQVRNSRYVGIYNITQRSNILMFAFSLLSKLYNILYLAHEM